MSTIAIIPARGGSKGIPQKNLTKVGGIPLVGRSVLAAVKATSIDRVFVSTDDDAIADCARHYGGEVVVRPAALSTDNATSETALLHVLDTLRETEGYVPDTLVFLQCTTPFTTADDIDKAVATLRGEKADSLFTAIRFDHFIWEDCEDPSEGVRGLTHNAAKRLLRQEKKPQYLENGAIYVMKVAGFLEGRHRFFGKIATCLMDRFTALEIDEPVELRMAQAIESVLFKTVHKLPENPSALIMDFDGVFTDNRVWVDESGRETVLCSRADGMGLEDLRKVASFPMLVLSKEKNPVVAARCAKVNLPCLQGVERKADILKKWAGEQGIDLRRAIYVGNDRNDLECFQLVGCAVAPSDGEQEVLTAANIVLSRAGGSGAIRELTDALRAMMKPR
jgi:YrbI family 3-deoxy-D-manno-octulosonate 8-phosphate phosphatase